MTSLQNLKEYWEDVNYTMKNFPCGLSIFYQFSSVENIFLDINNRTDVGCDPYNKTILFLFTEIDSINEQKRLVIPRSTYIIWYDVC